MNINKEAAELKQKDVCINCKHEQHLYYSEGEFALEYCEEHEMILDEEKGINSMTHTCSKFERADK